MLDAVGRIVAQRGIEGIRVRQIAAEAELSPGAVLYHFPKNSDLLMAVHDDTVRRYIEARTIAAESSDEPAERLLAVMRAGIPPWANEHTIRLLYEMHGLARRSKTHAELLSDLWLKEHALYVDIINTGVGRGIFQPFEPVEGLASHLLALEDGLVLHLIGHNDAFSSQSVIERLAGFAALALDHPNIAVMAGTPA